jgi:curved DNA-binding protein CbpA
MDHDTNVDHYETLQVSPNADGDTIQRVYRLLAGRFHPDNAETGNEARFRQIHAAYYILSDPERRAKYDAMHGSLRQARWRLASSGATADNDFEIEQSFRVTVLEILYSRRRMEPGQPALSQLELEQLTGRPREHLEFTIWYLTQRKLVTRSDNSSLIITVDGVDYLEKHKPSNLQQLRLTG